MSSLFASSVTGRGQVCRFLNGTALGLMAALALEARAQEPNQAVASRVLTNIYQIWEMPYDQRSRPYRMQTEVLIYYIDPEWSCAWGECLGRPAYLPIFDSPTPLVAGQRVAIDGVVVPIQERFTWGETRVRIQEESVALPEEPVRNLSENPLAMKSRRVMVEGLIDRQMEDPTHVTLNFLAGDMAATVYVLKGSNGPSPHFSTGDFIRMKCVYSPQFDRDGNLSDLSLWVARPADIEVIGSLATDPRFAAPLVLADAIREDTPTNDLLRVEGIVRNHEPGKWITLWDAAGQVMVQSRQTQPLRFGDRVEAVGYASVLGVQQFLRGGLYRRVTSTNGLAPIPLRPPDRLPLRLAEQVRDLSLEEANRRLPVSLRAVVTWSHEATPFAYVQDASSGVRVANPKWEGPDASKPGTIVNVRGEVTAGDFVPIVTNAVLSRVGWWTLEPGQLVTLEQALTGVEDGRWVEMRGLVRGVKVMNGLAQLELSTSGGEFQAWIPASQSFEYLSGSIVRVHGVCAAVANARHQLTGIQMWIPHLKYLQVDEAAPDDLFAVPYRSLGGLRRFNLLNSLNQRVRTSGTVVLHAPGRYLYLQDGLDGVFALSQQKEPLRPGDQVDVVGFPGNQGRRFLLREAVYRRRASGPEPVPMQLATLRSVNLDLEGLLAQAEGTLLNFVQTDDEVRLLIHAGNSVFEVSLDSGIGAAASSLHNLDPGSLLSLTGVYEVQSDEYGNPHSFVLRLRSADDVRLLQRAPWWTLSRLLWVLLALLAVFAVALAWGLLISHKNALLRQAQTELQLAHDRLELRVEERTKELQEEVAAKERAHAELAQTQKNLMLASRQAGMAEVATGILHNVGNVLNSVNVSTGLVCDHLDRVAVESVSRVAALLQQHHDQIGRFMTDDPRGKALPGYLKQLGEVLIQDKRDMRSEIASLAKNVEHIKVIIAMQQSYAKLGGVLEEHDPKDLAEEALQINCAALDRHAVHLTRDYEPVPRILVDRHKVLQILINVIANAKQALNERSSDKKLIVSVGPGGPDRVRFTVTDNGVGIPPENLSRIFSQGFTTRKSGHGFGLHSSANAARELGGSLTAQSPGPGQGATFILELPTAEASARLFASGSGVEAAGA
jgi:signal transduction histidine kinase